MGAVRGNTSFWNVVPRPSHEHNKFFGSLDLLAFIHRARFSDPANTSLRGGPAARHLTNVSVLTISLPLTPAHLRACRPTVARRRLP
jgi:hypothetical protein